MASVWSEKTPFGRQSLFYPKMGVARREKVHGMASDGNAVYESGVQKLDEFRRLAYPKSVLRGACTYMAAVTACYAWIRVRHVVDTW